MKLLVSAIALLISTSLYAQLTIFAEAGSENGRGILKQRGDECFAIIPNHLLREHFGSVSIYGEGSVLAESELVKSYTSDLAILRLEKNSDLVCTSWKLDRDFQKVIDVVTKCKLEMREKTGGVSTMSMSVTAIDGQFLYVKPDNFRDIISKGMSGSSVFTEYNGRKVYLGMLQSVTDNTGEILLADVMEDTLEDFFNPRKKIRQSSGGSNVSLGISKEVGGFKFELMDIERSGTNVVLKFNAISMEQDETIYVRNYNISLFDDKGLESNAKNIVLGSNSHHTVNYSMIHGVSVPMEISFNNISSSTEAISLFSLNFTVGKTDYSFEIRDVELPGATTYGSQYDQNAIDGSQTISGFKFDLINVSKSGQEVTCNFNVTSMERDRTIYLRNYNVLLYDDKGFTNKAKNITMGNKSHHTVEYNTIHGVSIPLELKFEGVNSSAENIALLKIAFNSMGQDSEYQQRNIPFESAQVPDTRSVSNTRSKGGSASSSGCSEIIVYRMKGIAQCEEDIILNNHDEKVLTLASGTRYKTTICHERECSFKATSGAQELVPGFKNADIQLGKTYYFKISCVLGTTVITQPDPIKAEEDLNKKGKFKRQMQTFKLNNW